MALDPTIADLLKQGLITEDELDVAVNEWFAAPGTKRLAVGRVHHLNVGTGLKQNAFLGKTLRRNGFVGRTLRDPDPTEGLKRAALRKAILLAHPEKQ